MDGVSAILLDLSVKVVVTISHLAILGRAGCTAKRRQYETGVEPLQVASG